MIDVLLIFSASSLCETKSREYFYSLPCMRCAYSFIPFRLLFLSSSFPTWAFPWLRTYCLLTSIRSIVSLFARDDESDMLPMHQGGTVRTLRNGMNEISLWPFLSFPFLSLRSVFPSSSALRCIHSVLGLVSALCLVLSILMAASLRKHKQTLELNECSACVYAWKAAAGSMLSCNCPNSIQHVTSHASISTQRRRYRKAFSRSGPKAVAIDEAVAEEEADEAEEEEE